MRTRDLWDREPLTDKLSSGANAQTSSVSHASLAPREEAP